MSYIKDEWQVVTGALHHSETQHVHDQVVVPEVAAAFTEQQLLIARFAAAAPALLHETISRLRLTQPLAACRFRLAAFAAAPVRGCGFLVRAFAPSASALGTCCTANHNSVHGGRAARSGKWSGA